MFANLDRNDFIALLNKLGSPDDAEALSAARDLHAKVTVADVTWDMLLAPEKPAARSSEDAEEDVDAIDLPSRDDDIVLVAPEPDHGALSEADKAEVKTLIDAIGAMEISDVTRGELTDYAADLVTGTLEQMDLRYLRALKKRLKG